MKQDHVLPDVVYPVQNSEIVSLLVQTSNDNITVSNKKIVTDDCNSGVFYNTLRATL